MADEAAQKKRDYVRFLPDGSWDLPQSQDKQAAPPLLGRLFRGPA